MNIDAIMYYLLEFASDCYSFSWENSSSRICVMDHKRWRKYFCMIRKGIDILRYSFKELVDLIRRLHLDRSITHMSGMTRILIAMSYSSWWQYSWFFDLFLDEYSSSVLFHILSFSISQTRFNSVTSISHPLLKLSSHITKRI